MNKTKPSLNFKCKHEGCSNPKHSALGYCYKHYMQFKKHKRTFDITSRDFNEVVDCGDHYELILLDRKMNENGRAKIDKEDLSRVKEVNRWGLDKNGYVANSTANILMHRLIMDAKDDEEIDHKETGIEHRSDNRKENLRVATNQENQFNAGKRKDNKSGFKGVCKKGSKWVARTTNNGKTIHLGYFNTPEEASKAYNEAAKLLHGEFMHKSLVTTGSVTFKRKRLIRFSRKNQPKNTIPDEED